MPEEKNILTGKKYMLVRKRGKYLKRNSVKSLINIRFILLISIFLALTLFFVSSLPITTAASSYVRSSPAYTFGHQTAPFIGGQQFPLFDRSQCQAGQDFILQVDPLGCTPSVIRSDLLEDQEVVVFCPISATQLNPLIKIKDIDYMIITPKDLPREVLTVGYYPARAALGKWDPDIKTPILGNIGYATIVLRRQPNESAMPDFVQGNLTAKLVYDIDNAFGTGRAVYYLRQMSDEEWNRGYTAYGFWDGRGYLRLEGADNTGATIGVYSDRDQTGNARLGEKTKIANLDLEKGKTSREVFLPGFNYCMGGIEVKLEDFENPDTRARLRVDSEVIEMKTGEKFLENKCLVKSISKQGINQKVEVSCQEDERRNPFLLRISPKVSLSINGEAKEYGAGDLLYDDKDNSYYLGFVGSSGQTNSLGEVYIRIISIPKSRGGIRTSLSESDLSFVASYDKKVSGKNTKGSVIEETKEFFEGIVAQLSLVENKFFRGADLKTLTYSDSEKQIFGKTLSIKGYSGAPDTDISQMPKEVRENYENAMKDYLAIKESFSGDRYPPNDIRTLGEQALTETIRLAKSLEQRSTILQLCREFSETYGSAPPEISTICDNGYLLSNTQTSERSVVINGKTHILAFEGVREPSFDEFGLEIIVASSEGPGEYDLSKGERVYINSTSNEYIQLINLEEDSAILVTGLLGRNIRTSQRLKIGTEETFESRYSFRIKEIHLQKVAKVSLNPKIDYARTNATINFKIGIEKRAIQLSPEKTKERIQTLNKTIEKWTKINDGLGKVVKAGKAACLATAGALTIKNFFSNLGGKGIARQTVMKAPGTGWYDKCQKDVKDVKYESVEACLLANSDSIESSVNSYADAMKKQNDEIKKLEEGISDTRFLGEKVVNTDALAQKLMNDPAFISDINSCKNDIQIVVGGKTISAVDVYPINPNTTTISQARALQLNCRLLSSSDTDVQAIAKSNVEKTFGEIYSNSRTEATRLTFNSQYGISPIVGSTKKLKEFPLTDVKTFGQVKSKFSGATISDDTYVTTFIDQTDGKQYLITLTNEYVVSQTYLIGSGGVLSVANSNNVNHLGIGFKKYDSATYSNTYISPKVRYYETDPYQGFPSVVPFDTKNGWYAAVKSNVPALGGLKAYDDSGRVSSFYVCNVGPNGREENIGGDDICRGFYPGAQQPPDFPGLTEQESRTKMEQAQRAIQQAQNEYKDGVKEVTITAGGQSQRIKVGEPAANIPGIQCEDFMSPSDCNIMFNVCDPFVCPSSRCDLGGAYPVKDVIQSGIAGSIALCLPNWPEIKVPICVSGVHAGLEGYKSVLSSYQQCLQTSLDTGQTVGICDELNSIYMCDFFWRQGLPLIKYAIPKVVGSVLGQNVRGGGEYLGVADAASNAQKSIDYFSQYYAANSFAAFKARSLESVGTDICRNWVSLTGPKGNLFDALISPDSPPQFYGRFEEIPYTTATNPPASQYKVFYHIYAGKDLPAYYQVYLRGTGGSFYQDTAFRRPVASGFIKTGDFKSETIDFNAPSGYKELCIVVNNQEQCGFKQVTTDFGVNYLSEKYVQQQASQKDIKSEAECVSGNPSAFSFLNPNLQAGAEEALNPAIYNRGITRVCSTENPGKTSDPLMNTKNQRWKDVGNCGSANLKCWLDTDSVNKVIKNANILNETLGVIGDREKQIIDALTKEGKYLDNFDSFQKELEGLQDSEIISKINENIGRVYRNNQKGYLYFKRGNAYGNQARLTYRILLDTQNLPITQRDSEPLNPIEEPTETPEQPKTGEEPTEAARCEKECGVVCSKTECESLGCTFVPDPVFNKIFPLIFNNCIPKEQPTEPTTEAITQFKKTLGEKIIKLAKEKEQERTDPDYSTVQADTGAKSFECLALQVALIESSIRQCKKTPANGNNPLYCEGDSSETISGDAFKTGGDSGSRGIMQINTAFKRKDNGQSVGHCGSYDLSSNREECRTQLSYFETNVNTGLNLLIEGYDKDEKSFDCNGKKYSGWARALRNYNGWGCTGNTNYVENVISARDDVARLFPEVCGETKEVSVSVSPVTYSKAELMGRSSTIKGLTSETIKAFFSMKAAAETDGFILNAVSGYRTFNRQLDIWNDKFASFSGTDQEKATKTAEFSAVPGMSRHHWGTEIDINSVDPSYWQNNVALYEWLVSNAPTYGFCQSYDEDRGVVKTEKWHWSYKPISKQLTQQYSDTIIAQDITGLGISGETTIISNFDFYKRGSISDINPDCLS